MIKGLNILGASYLMLQKEPFQKIIMKSQNSGPFVEKREQMWNSNPHNDENMTKENHTNTKTAN
jgi:hypothetical protein